MQRQYLTRTNGLIILLVLCCSDWQGTDTSVHLRQYKADGTVFWNHVFVAALRNSERKIINYVGIQHPLDKVRVAQLQMQDSAAFCFAVLTLCCDKEEH